MLAAEQRRTDEQRLPGLKISHMNVLWADRNVIRKTPTKRALNTWQAQPVRRREPAEMADAVLTRLR